MSADYEKGVCSTQAATIRLLAARAKAERGESVYGGLLEDLTVHCHRPEGDDRLGIEAGRLVGRGWSRDAAIAAAFDGLYQAYRRRREQKLLERERKEAT